MARVVCRYSPVSEGGSAEPVVPHSRSPGMVRVVCRYCPVRSTGLIAAPVRVSVTAWLMSSKP